MAFVFEVTESVINASLTRPFHSFLQTSWVNCSDEIHHLGKRQRIWIRAGVVKKTKRSQLEKSITVVGQNCFIWHSTSTTLYFQIVKPYNVQLYILMSPLQNQASFNKQSKHGQLYIKTLVKKKPNLLNPRVSHILSTNVDAVWLIFAGKETCIQHDSRPELSEALPASDRAVSRGQTGPTSSPRWT